jgi:hypothetical protein
MQWILDVNSRICHLALEVSSQHIWVVHQDFETMVASFFPKISIVVESLVKKPMHRHISVHRFVLHFFRVPT